MAESSAQGPSWPRWLMTRWEASDRAGLEKIEVTTGRRDGRPVVILKQAAGARILEPQQAREFAALLEEAASMAERDERKE